MKKITTVAAALALMTSSLLPTSVLAQEGQLNLPEFQDLGDGSENLALNMKVSASSNEGTAGKCRCGWQHVHALGFPRRHQ